MNVVQKGELAGEVLTTFGKLLRATPVADRSLAVALVHLALRVALHGRQGLPGELVNRVEQWADGTAKGARDEARRMLAIHKVASLRAANAELRARGWTRGRWSVAELLRRAGNVASLSPKRVEALVREHPTVESLAGRTSDEGDAPKLGRHALAQVPHRTCPEQLPCRSTALPN